MLVLTLSPLILFHVSASVDQSLTAVRFWHAHNIMVCVISRCTLISFMALMLCQYVNVASAGVYSLSVNHRNQQCDPVAPGMLCFLSKLHLIVQNINQSPPTPAHMSRDSILHGGGVNGSCCTVFAVSRCVFMSTQSFPGQVWACSPGNVGNNSQKPMLDDTADLTSTAIWPK